MDFSGHPLNRQQYSTVNQTSDSTVQYSISEVLRNLADVIPNDGYAPFYAKMLRELGQKRFFELANLATPYASDRTKLSTPVLRHLTVSQRCKAC